jgi:hypothetical protein
LKPGAHPPGFPLDYYCCSAPSIGLVARGFPSPATGSPVWNRRAPALPRELGLSILTSPFCCPAMSAQSACDGRHLGFATRNRKPRTCRRGVRGFFLGGTPREARFPLICDHPKQCEHAEHRPAPPWSRTLRPSGALGRDKLLGSLPWQQLPVADPPLRACEFLGIHSSTSLRGAI